ncbi:MAG: ChaN family lipoprotein, partial [marine benthic group bacterium]|nr:ChaN family lipoprotein [Gemmatimonadota bacterium]
MNRMMIIAALPLVLMIALPANAQDSSPGVGDSAYVAGEYRVYTGAGEPSSIDDIVAAMGDYTVVFVGEAHDDPTGHMLEAELYRRAYETYGAPDSNDGSPRPVALSLEFFQSDTQLIVDEYLAGLITEKAFLADSRPWPRYETDYRPMIELSKEHGLTVIAANAPRRYANRVTQHGRESLEALSPEALASLAPLPYGQPSDAYRGQWIQIITEVMEEEGMKCGISVEQLAAEGEEVRARAPVGAHGNMGNQLHSQVLWDATMAWWISQYLEE